MTNFIKATLVQGAIVGIQCIVYFGTQFIEGEPHLLGNALDKAIPFVPVFIYPYVFWYVMLATMALLLYAFSAETFAKYAMASVLAVIIAGVIFLAYPTTLERPEVELRGFTGRLISFVYNGDYRCVNCLPSLHCTLAFLFMFGALSCAPMPLAIKLGVCVISLAIVAATLLVKQHVIVDAVAALLLAGIVWIAAGRIGADRFLALLKMT